MNSRATLVIAKLLVLAPMLVLFGLTGCGGGGEEERQHNASAQMPAASAATATTPARKLAVTSVQLEGCVVDRYFIPAEGRVEALRADGRAEAQGDTDAHGVFRLRVPTDSKLRIRLAGRADSETLEVLVLRHDLSVAACLIDEARG